MAAQGSWDEKPGVVDLLVREADIHATSLFLGKIADRFEHLSWKMRLYTSRYSSVGRT